MEFLKKPLFDFCYGGKPFADLDVTVERQENGQTLTTVYTLADGLRITNVLTRYDDACEWVNWFENTGDSPTEILSGLCDAAVALPLSCEAPVPPGAHIRSFDEVTAVHAPAGSVWTFDEFACFADRIVHGRYEGELRVGERKSYACYEGRSSDGQAPFFDVHKAGKGYIFAIGWTGQWNCTLERREEEIVVKTGLEDTHFRLLAGEKLRTSSFVLMPYEGSVQEGQNKWRRLVRAHFSLIGQEGRAPQTPICASVWGGMKSAAVLERIKIIRENGLPFEYIWMDAGWYGADTLPTPDEFEGDWSVHTGDWRVSPHIHPNGLADVSAAVHEAGMKFLLWAEPERVRPKVPTVAAHPEYFLSYEAKPENLLLDLGNEAAWRYCFETLSELIDRLNIDCYRQDFNMRPLPYWREKDAEDRKGITEIKHIMGLYRLWDALLARFPHLIIDNCASGGRRIDMETLRRSVPLWRSDYQCPENPVLEGTQCHHLSFNSWIPHSSTAPGRTCDTYAFRSGFGPGMNIGYFYNECTDFGEDPEKLKWLKARIEEYRKVRPYFAGDFYPLTAVSDRKDVWCASRLQLEDKGVLLLFRREEAPYETAFFPLQGIDGAAKYRFTDADGGSWQLSGEEILTKGVGITMPDPRSSKIIFFEKI